jgi:hypothetical protein
MSHIAGAVQLRKRDGRITPSDEPGDLLEAARIDQTTNRDNDV